MDKDLIRQGFGGPGEEPLPRREPDLREAGCAGLGDQTWRGDGEIELPVRIGGGEPGIDPHIAAVVERELGTRPGGTFGSPRDDFRSRLVKCADLDDAFLDHGGLGVLA